MPLLRTLKICFEILKKRNHGNKPSYTNLDTMLINIKYQYVNSMYPQLSKTVIMFTTSSKLLK